MPTDPSAPDRTVRYGSHPDQVVDLRLPPTATSRPLVIFIHGGFWRVAYDRTHVGPLAADLAARGWPTATVEYRRVGQDGGGWPGTLEDIAAAIGAVVDESDTAAPPILAGHSAGGHLALWAARDTSTSGVLALAPVCDLRAAYSRHLGQGAVAALLGGGPDDVPDRFLAADPLARLPLGAAMMLVHGVDDDVVPVDLSRGFVEAARAAGDSAELVALPGVEHFGVIDPESEAWPSVLRALAALAPGQQKG
jgi:acetyl esterase/lipase